MPYISSIFKSFADVKVQSWAFVIGLIVISFLLAKVLRKKEQFNTRKLTYASMCIAISFVLSYIRFYHWPQGGSITPGSMLPLMLFAFMFGPVEGILAGMVYGLLQLIQDPFIVHWFQVLLDYPFAFGAIGLAGYAKKNLSVGILVGGFGRFCCSFLSGVFFFANYAPPNMSPILYSASVNGAVIGTEVLICFGISLIPQFKHAITKIKITSVA